MSRAALYFGSALIVAVAAAGANASAGTIANIDLGGYYNGSWTSEINGPTVASGAESGTGNAGTGISFSDPTGAYDSVLALQTITFSPVALTADSVVNSLMNQFYGPDGAEITFENSAGQSDTVTLVSGDTIRDYNNDGYFNSLDGFDPGVMAMLWWSTGDSAATGNGEPSQRLDVQTFVLPSSWAGTDLVSMSIATTGTGPDSTVLSALQVDANPVSAVPEPASLALLGTALLGLAGLGVRRART